MLLDVLPGETRLPATHQAPELSTPLKPTRTLRVAVAGCGTVGGALVTMLHERSAVVRLRHGVAVEVAGVLVLGSGRAKPPELDPQLVTTDVDRFLAVDADVVVEAIGGSAVARVIAEEALRAGRRLVTANKLLIAECGPALVDLARTNGGALDFEAAVAGGVPVVRALRDQVGAGGVRAVRGIVNGTTNFVLDRMDHGSSYADALRDAQALGYAEADPTRDVSGADAADKMRILAWLAFGVEPASVELAIEGIGPALEARCARARAECGVVRLVGEVVADGDGVRGSVAPRIVAASSAFGATRGAENLVEVETAWGGVLRWSGPGAGGAATASALLGDVLRAAGPFRSSRWR